MFRNRTEGHGDRSLIESLENRLLLSRSVPISPLLRGQGLLGEAVESAKPTIIVKGRVNAPFSNPTDVGPMLLSAPFSPAQIASAYGVNDISFGGMPGDGSGQTVAIIDAYNTPSIIPDAAAFSTRFSLPQFNVSGGPTLTVLNQDGDASPLPANATSGNWDLEASLDVQWVHAIAPKANIVLFEANTSSFLDLFAAVTTAAGYTGVSAVSMSFGGGEFSSETFFDSTFQTPGGHPGVTFLASTGDSGKPGSYPAYSPNVVAVGGTSLTINNDGSWGGESGWSGSGGGISKWESQPGYQNGKVNGLSTTQRTIPDVSMNANPSTGVYVLDSYSGGPDGWYIVGGTSLACPTTAGLVAITNQGRALLGLPMLNGASQTLPMLYNQPASNFHDVLTGNNGFAAGAGYDLVTGIGTPIADLLVPSLAGFTGAITGNVFQDSNSSSIMDSGEPGVSNATVYIDANNNGVRDGAEVASITSASGLYSFTGLGAGTYNIREIPPTGYIATSTAQVILNAGGSSTNINLATVATGYTGTSGNDDYLLRLDNTATYYQIFVGGVLGYTINTGLTSNALTFNLGAGDDSLTIDYTNGDPLPAGGVIYSGGTSVTDNTLRIIGASSADAFDVTPFQVLHGGKSISYANAKTLNLDTGAFTVGDDLNGMAVTVGASSSADFNVSQHLGSFTINGGQAATPAGAGMVLVTTGLTIPTGSLDLADNDMIVVDGILGTWNNPDYDGLTGYLESGAITSSSAQSQFTKLGIASASDALSIGGMTTGSFDGQTVSPNDVLIKFTYVGDANLDGKVNIDDYGRIDGNVAQSGIVFGWFNGDFNLDGKINIDDYGLIDGVVGVQGPVL